MAPASHLPVSRNAAAWRAHSCGYLRVLALLPILAALLAPAIARGDIYTWTDEQGRVVVSDVQPADPGKASDLKLLAAASGPAAKSPAAGSEPAAGRKEQELQARIEELERQLEEEQSAQQRQAVPQASDAGSYYPAPPPEAGYYSSSPGNYTAHYVSYYYPSPPAYTVIVVPAKPLVRRPASAPRPVFAPRPVNVNRPVFASRQPQFVSRTPQFVSRRPEFVSRPAPENSKRGAFGGRPIQRGGLIRSQR